VIAVAFVVIAVLPVQCFLFVRPNNIATVVIPFSAFLAVT